MRAYYWQRLDMLKLITLVINLFIIPYKAKEPKSVLHNQQSLNRTPKTRKILYHHEFKVLKEVLGSYHHLQNTKHLKESGSWEVGPI